MYDSLIEDLLFYIPLKNFSLVGDVTIASDGLQKKSAKGLWAGKDLFRATPAVTRGSSFPDSSEGPPHSVASYDTQQAWHDKDPSLLKGRH
jgi:hypothetical protein